MLIRFNGKCNCGCGNPVYFRFISHWFKVSWHLDYEDWFLYIHFGKHAFRFSSAGFMKFKTSRGVFNNENHEVNDK